MDQGKRKFVQASSALLAGWAVLGEVGLAQGKRVPMTPEKLMTSIINLSNKARVDGFGEVADHLLKAVDMVIHRKGE